MELVHKNITVVGVVQGVGFRFHTIRIAKTLGIKGYIKNLPDGNVYIEAEAPPENIDDFINWCYQGPPRSRVSDVIITESEIVNYKGFDVKY